MSEKDFGVEAAPLAAGDSADLSADVVQAMERQAGDTVRCTRVTAETYRCNWWAPESTAGYDNALLAGLLVTTHRVRKSRYLHVTRTQAGLVIKDLLSRAG